MRHCEESDDEAIQQNYWIAALHLDPLRHSFSEASRLGVVRNDGCEGLLKSHLQKPETNGILLLRSSGVRQGELGWVGRKWIGWLRRRGANSD